MKLAFFISLAVNLLLAIHHFTHLPTKTPTDPPPSASSQAPGKVKTNTVTLALPGTVVDWRTVESSDYKEYIANLRKIGCPEETIRDIIIADVNKLFESKRKEIAAKTPPVEFWKPGLQMFTATVDDESIKQRQELAKEKRALLKELLGVDVPEKNELANVLNPIQRLLDFLPAEKQSEVAQILERFQAKSVKAMGDGMPDAEDMKNIKNLQTEMEAELARLLTPEEKENYDLRLSQTAMMMRMQMAAFEPNEKEFRDIFKLKKQFDDEYNPLTRPGEDKETAEKRKAAKEALDKQIEETLGPDRAKQYKLAQSPTYSALYKLAERHEIPKESAAQVYEMKKALESELARLKSNSQTMSPEEIKALGEQMAQETQKSARQVLGDKAFEAYLKQPNAAWLKGKNVKE